jgi:hypothetical protein
LGIFTFAAAICCAFPSRRRRRCDRPGRVRSRRRIVNADLCDLDYLDLVESAYLLIGGDGRAEFADGALNATGELEYGRSIFFFRRTGFDEGDDLSESGSAEIEEDGSLEIEPSFDNGDDAISTARRE